MLVCVVGNFGDGQNVSDGQRIKTVELYKSLSDRYGEKQIGRVNLQGSGKLALACKLLICLMRSKHVIVLVSVNGRKKVIPLLDLFNRIFRRKIYHSLIGSTTHITLQENPKLVRCYERLAGNWSETSTEKKLLEECGLTNVSVIKNFKNLTIIAEEELVYPSGEPYRFCTFMRVEAKKGIPEIVNAINEINAQFGRTVCTLDIYGYVMPSYVENFEELKQSFGENIRYMGVVEFGESVNTLKNYFMLVFPTRYYTEGIPGTLLDAYSAGLPVLSAEWESCYDVVTPEVGITYAFDDFEALKQTMIDAISNPDTINAMKSACLKEAKNYTSEKILDVIEVYWKDDM